MNEWWIYAQSILTVVLHSAATGITYLEMWMVSICAIFCYQRNGALELANNVVCLDDVRLTF